MRYRAKGPKAVVYARISVEHRAQPSMTINPTHITVNYSQYPDLFCFEIVTSRIEFFANCSYCHVIGAHAVTNHPTKLQSEEY